MQHNYNAKSNLWSRPDFNGIAYSDGKEFEDLLLEKIRATKDCSVFSEELAAHIDNWGSEYHLTTYRHGLMRPLPFESGESVLELGCGCGAITRYLGEKGMQVTAIEGGVRRAEITAERVRDLSNVKVILDDLVAFQTEERFDWVTLIGVLEYSPSFAPGSDPVEAYLRQAIRYLKPGGRLIVAIENQLGLKYFNGCGEDHVGTPFFGPQELYDGKKVVTFGRQELARRLKSAGFADVDFLYPFPDYKLPQVVVSEAAFKDPDFVVADMLLRLESRDYVGRPLRLFSEQLVARTLEDNGVLQDFANSFLAVASTAGSPLPENTPLAWSFAFSRRAPYRTETVFEKTAAGITVDKHLVMSKAPPRADPELEHKVGQHKYSIGRLLAWPILKAKLAPSNATLSNAFEPYLAELFTRSAPLEDASPGKLESWQTSGALIDLTPFNIVSGPKGTTPIDMEWSLPGTVPTGWILMRSIIQMMACSISGKDPDKTTLLSLMDTLCQRAGLTFDHRSLNLWMAFEQTFIDAASGRSFPPPPANQPLVTYPTFKRLDVDATRDAISTENDSLQRAALPFEDNYRLWLDKRNIYLSTTPEFIRHQQASEVSVHILLLPRPDSDGLPPDDILLADTLDSLGKQWLDNWHMDVITRLSKPDGIDDISCLSWQALDDPDLAPRILAEVSSRKAELVLAIPIGTRLAPHCLWRLTKESSCKAEAQAFFVDDDCCTPDGEQHSPRFKPGTNPSAMECSDLAGPLAIRRNTWEQLGGLFSFSNPWYVHLLTLAKAIGWQSISHIPDVLLTYPVRYPNNTEQNMGTFAAHLAMQGDGAELLRINERAWARLLPPSTTPEVAIHVLSCGNTTLLSRCVDSILATTSYSNYTITIVVDAADWGPDFEQWVSQIPPSVHIDILASQEFSTHVGRCSGVLARAKSEYSVLMRDEVVIIQAEWLDHLLACMCDPQIGMTGPRFIAPGTGEICYSGGITGLMGEAAYPDHQTLHLGEKSYLDMAENPRDVTFLSSACLLVRNAACSSFLLPKSIGDSMLHLELAIGNLLLKSGYRLRYQPTATLVFEDAIQAEFSSVKNALPIAPDVVPDPYWNLNLSLCHTTPNIEHEYSARWHVTPDITPRILARPLVNGQGVFRITGPLNALQKTGRASECLIFQEDQRREPNIAEILRLSADTLIVQHYLYPSQLEALQTWRQHPDRPFIVYTADDLLTQLDSTNPFVGSLPPNPKGNLKFALAQCDRLVVTTEYLADCYRAMISDIRIVPNRLEQELWLPLRSQRCTTSRPRVGWAGGITHGGDLPMLKKVIEATSKDADWVFFGMCPEEIRPLIHEYHEFVNFRDYPAALAALNLDIAVAPLADTAFNRAKSNLRLLEYGILGIPVVCSNIEPYRNSPACAVSNDTRAWIEALQERIHDPDARQAEGNTMRRWVQQHFLLEDHLDDWLSAHLQ